MAIHLLLYCETLNKYTVLWFKGMKELTSNKTGTHSNLLLLPYSLPQGLAHTAQAHMVLRSDYSVGQSVVIVGQSQWSIESNCRPVARKQSGVLFSVE